MLVFIHKNAQRNFDQLKLGVLPPLGEGFTTILNHIDGSRNHLDSSRDS